MTGKVFSLILTMSHITGCAVDSPFDRQFVADEIGARTGNALPHIESSGAIELPEYVALDDGLSEDEAVVIALWNNADFNGDLSTIGLARADLLEAGLLPNPVLSLLFPGTDTVREGTLSMPINLARRRARIAVAELDLEKVANDLIQSGLGLVRDVRIAYAEFGLAQTRLGLVAQSSAVLDEIAAITERQYEAGEISRIEWARTVADSLRSVALGQDAAREVAATQTRLLEFLGLTDSISLSRTEADVLSEPTALPPLESLLDIAMTSRPDLRAAEIAVESAAESANWERRQIYEFVAILDYGQVRGQSGADTGPGFDFALPVFDRNQSGRQRTSARIEETAFRYLAAQRRVSLEVNESHAAYLAALEALAVWREGVIPELQASVNQTQQALNLGSVSRLAVLLAQRQLLEARISEAVAMAEVRRALAILSYAVGQRIDGR